MAKLQMWMVRAGEGGFLFEEFRASSYVAIGWNAFDRENVLLVGPSGTGKTHLATALAMAACARE